MDAQLVSLEVSPYTRKARWALELSGCKFQLRSYSPLFSEPWLRWKLGDWTGRVTLPVILLSSGGALRDSYDIAVWGNEHRAKDARNLFPEAEKDAVRQWNEKSELLLGFVRITAITEAKKDPASLKGLLPPFLRGLGPLTTLVCKKLIATVEAKYKAQGTPKEQALAVLREISAALKAGAARLPAQGAPRESPAASYLVGGALTYADIAVAVPLKLMQPVGAPYNSLGGSPGGALEIPGMLDGFPDLVAWRDGIYREFFPQK